MSMKFPVIEGTMNNLDGSSICPVCRKNVIYQPERIVLTAGALSVYKPGSDQQGDDTSKDGSISPEIAVAKWGDVGFWILEWHRMKNNKVKGDTAANLDIVKDSKHGQFDLYFCSIQCLRTFFNEIVDEFEKVIDKAATRS